MKTTLNKIREHNPCTDGWKKLLAYLGKTKPYDEPLSLLTILDSNGLQDTLWCLRAVEGYDREIRLYAVWCVRQAQHLLTDKRSLDALDVAERYANGEATDAELAAARDAAWEAIRDTADAARVAWDAAAPAAAAAAAAAAGAAAGDAAWSAAYAAAREAAEAAAWSARNAARADAEAKQEAELRRICGEG